MLLWATLQSDRESLGENGRVARWLDEAGLGFVWGLCVDSGIDIFRDNGIG